MTHGLPVVSAKKALKALESVGFFVHHVKGSHHVLRHRTDRERRIVIPLHNKDLKPGTLHRIIKDAGMSVEDFTVLL
jgi:predicted RNA binding protein YcfA (HicA-like mRNA interferase family)